MKSCRVRPKNDYKKSLFCFCKQSLMKKCNPHGKEASFKMLKSLMIIAMAAAVLSLGACAHKDTATTQTTSASKGYSK